MAYCPDCKRGNWACACRLSIADKIRTVQLHTSCTPSRSRRRYWDGDALKDQFGEDATEKTKELTGGGFAEGP